MHGINIQVSNVVGCEDSPRLTFDVAIDITDVLPESDADGELFNQRFGQEILTQLITQLRGEHA